MLTSILGPVVHGQRGRSARVAWMYIALHHSLGMVLSAACVGGLLVALAGILDYVGVPTVSLAFWLVVIIVAAYLPRLFGWTEFPALIQSTRQVPRRWAVDYPPRTTAFLFGLGLGSGLYTRIMVPTYYLLLCWPFLAPNSAWPVMGWVLYGLARSGNLWLLACTAPVSEDPLHHANVLVVRIMRWQRWMSRLNALLLVAAVGYLIGEHWR